MPIQYRVIPEDRLVEAHYAGELSIQDMQDFARSIMQHPEFTEDFRLLSIITGIKTDITSVEFMQFSDWRTPFPRYQQMAIVAPSDFEYGIARMFQMASHSAGAIELQIFRNLKEARAWLELPDE